MLFCPVCGNLTLNQILSSSSFCTNCASIRGVATVTGYVALFKSDGQEVSGIGYSRTSCVLQVWTQATNIKSYSVLDGPFTFTPLGSWGAIQDVLVMDQSSGGKLLRRLMIYSTPYTPSAFVPFKVG